VGTYLLGPNSSGIHCWQHIRHRQLAYVDALVMIQVLVEREAP
jgi:hypothetical protein